MPEKPNDPDPGLQIPEKALKNVAVINSGILGFPYRGDGPHACDRRSRRDGLHRRVISLVNVIGRVLIMKLTDYYRYLQQQPL